MINVARQAAETFGSHVEIFDSGQVSLGTGFQAMEAAAAALSGASFQAVREVALRTREAIRLIAVIDTMEYLKRSGRISWLSANLGDLLKIKVLLEIIDGVVQSLGNVRTRTKAIARIQSLAASWGPLRRMAVVHSDIPEEAKAFAEQIRRFCHEPPLVINVTTVIGAHVGPGALGVIGLRQSP
jgi:DegV family protein with EDD domain